MLDDDSSVLSLVPFNVRYLYSTLQLELNDTGSAERFRASIPTNYYRHCQGVILMYDITDHASLISLEEWITEMQGKTSSSANLTYCVIGNKLDQTVDEKDLLTQGKYIGERLEIPEHLYFKISTAKETKQSLRNMLKVLAHAIHTARSSKADPDNSRDTESVNLISHGSDYKKMRKCCSKR